MFVNKHFQEDKKLMVSELKRFDLSRDLQLNSEVVPAAIESDGGADRGHSLGIHRHSGEGERLDGSTNEEESNREGLNLTWSFMIFYILATRGQKSVESHQNWKSYPVVDIQTWTTADDAPDFNIYDH